MVQGSLRLYAATMFAILTPTRVGVPAVAALAFATVVGTGWFPDDIQIFVTLPMIGVTALASGAVTYWAVVSRCSRRAGTPAR